MAVQPPDLGRGVADAADGHIAGRHGGQVDLAITEIGPARQEEGVAPGVPVEEGPAGGQFQAPVVVHAVVVAAIVEVHPVGRAAHGEIVVEVDLHVGAEAGGAGVDAYGDLGLGRAGGGEDGGGGEHGLEGLHGGAPLEPPRRF